MLTDQLELHIACLPIFHKDWAPSTKLSQVFDSIVELLMNPNGESPSSDDPNIGIEFMNNRDEFNRKAREWTATYAH